MAKTIRFETPIPPSVNHAYTNSRKGRRVLTDTSKQWINDARILAKITARNQSWVCVESGKVVMELWAYWPDAKRRDIHNLHKLIADAFEKILYADDKQLLIRDMDFSVDKKNPRVEIAVSAMESN